MQKNHQSKKPAFVLGITANYAFAAGSLILGLNRHLSLKDYDILIMHEGLSEHDAQILASLPHCKLIEYSPIIRFIPDLPKEFSLAFIYRFEMFRMLEDYHSLIWLDCDMAIQGDLSELLNYGSLSMALSDNSFLKDGVPEYTLLRNFLEPIAGYKMDIPFYNSGVLLLNDSLPNPLKLYEWCMTKLNELYSVLRHTDQGILNLLIQKFPDIFTSFSTSSYNCYPLNPASNTAKIVHCCGPQKFWNNSLLSLSFPEWTRDYKRWIELGGSPYKGVVHNAGLAGFSTFKLLSKLIEELSNSLEANENK